MVKLNPASMTFDPNIFVTSVVNFMRSSTKSGSSTVSKISSCTLLRPVAIVQGPVTVPVNTEFFMTLETSLHAAIYKGNLPLLSGRGNRKDPRADF